MDGAFLVTEDAGHEGGLSSPCYYRMCFSALASYHLALLACCLNFLLVLLSSRTGTWRSRAVTVTWRSGGGGQAEGRGYG